MSVGYSESLSFCSGKGGRLFQITVPGGPFSQGNMVLSKNFQDFSAKF